MKIDVLKTKVKIIFPEEAEIFNVEVMHKELQVIYDNKDKNIELDLGKIETIDTTFIQLIYSLLKTLKNEEFKFEIKDISESAESVFDLYGIELKKA